MLPEQAASTLRKCPFAGTMLESIISKPSMRKYMITKSFSMPSKEKIYYNFKEKESRMD